MEPVKLRHWRQRSEPPTAAAVTALSADLGLHPLTARLLLTRGIDPEQAEEFLAARLAGLPDPFRLTDMQPAVARLAEALERQEPIAVHGDYDVDGMTGTVLLIEGLRRLGAGEVAWHIPGRLGEGYGLSGPALREAAARGTRLVISVDCGISAHAEAEIARDCGLDLIVTDHHQPAESLPTALAVINPHRDPAAAEFADLAGVGVAFFLLIALRRRLRESGWFAARQEPDLRLLLDLVALGTVADLVPLRGVNRVLVRHGLRLLEAGHRPGIRALKQVAGVNRMTAGTVGYQLAPRLNAAGRLADAGQGVELLLETDLVCAMALARRLDQHNRDRRALEERTLESAEAAIVRREGDFTHSIVLADPAWHPGVIGIVASRLVERYHRPTVLIALDGEVGKGSARSIRGFHLFRGLQACSACLDGFGGHAMAAGLSLATANLDALAEGFERVARQELTAEDLQPRLLHDGSLLLEEVDLPGLQQLAGMGPFGMGHPEPQVVVEGVRAMHQQVLHDRHLKFTVCQGGYSHPAIAFGMAGRRDEFRGELDLLVCPQVNQYRGRETVQLRVKDVRPSAGQVG